MLLPRKTFNDEVQALAFDFNVAIIGMNAEMKAHDTARKGLTGTRRDAMQLARRARAVADETWGMDK